MHCKINFLEYIPSLWCLLVKLFFCASISLSCFLYLTAPAARLRLRIDCEVGTQEPQVVILGEEKVYFTSRQPRAISTTYFERENVVSGGVPIAQGVLHFLAYKYFSDVDSFETGELNGFICYLKEVRKVLFVEARPGSLIITVECNSLQILEELWDDYCSGQLNEMAQAFLVTEEVIRAFGLINVKLTSTIEEEEYKACREYFLERPGGCDMGIVQPKY